MEGTKGTHVLVKVSPGDFGDPNADPGNVFRGIELVVRELHREPETVPGRDESGGEVRSAR